MISVYFHKTKASRYLEKNVFFKEQVRAQEFEVVWYCKVKEMLTFCFYPRFIKQK